MTTSQFSAAERRPLIYDPSERATRNNPFPVYRRLQEEDPVHWSPRVKSWILTRYADVRQIALNRTEISSGRLTPFFKSLPEKTQSLLAEVIHYLNLWLVFRDPPDHTRLRNLMSKALTNRAMEALRPNVEELARLLFDGVAKERDVEVIQQLAMPLPTIVIMDMLGIPRGMMHQVKRWSDDMVVFIGSARNVPDKYERAQRGIHEMAAYFRELIAERRASPRGDVVSALVNARDNDDSLSDDELTATCMLFLFGGNETTTNFLGNAIYALACHPDQQEMLRARPDLIGKAVEEFLRWEGPANGLARVVAEDIEFGGKVLKSGERIYAMQNAANRDPRIFEEPDRLDITRSPNPHVTFSVGAHFCLGSQLARLEGEVFVRQFLERFSRCELAVPTEKLEWVDAMIMRGLTSLPVRLTPAA